MYIICYRQGDGGSSQGTSRQTVDAAAGAGGGGVVVLYSSVTRDPSRSIVSVPSLRGLRVNWTWAEIKGSRC